MWRISEGKLESKTQDAYQTDDVWVLTHVGRMVCIENESESKFLTGQNSEVGLTTNSDGQLWGIGDTDEDGFFTLTWLDSNQLLTV